MLRFRPPPQTNVIDIYDDRAASWWDFSDPIFLPLYAMVPARLRYLKRHGIDVVGKHIADIGTGGGYVAKELAHAGAHVTGFDLAPRALHAAQQATPESAFAVASALHLPLANDSIDVAISTDVLVHIPLELGGAQAAIAEVARVLKPGGVFYFSTMNSTMLSRLVLITLGEDVLRVVHKGTHDPDTFISPDVMRRICDAHGLELTAHEGAGPTGLQRLAGRWTLKMGRWPSRAVMWQGHAKKRL